MSTGNHTQRHQETLALRGALLTLGEQTPPIVYGPRPSRHGPIAAQTRERIHALIWLVGLAGFLVPLILAPASRHADVLRAVALAWFLVFGLVNGLCVARDMPRWRIHWRGPDRRF